MKRHLRLASISLALLSLLGCGGKTAVRFGAVLPLTGEAGVYGTAIEKGIRLAIEEAKQQPDFPYPVEIVVVDSGSDPNRAKDELAKLYADGVIAVVGGVTSAEALQMVPVADERDRILMSPSASSPQLTGISKNFYRVFASDILEGSKMGIFATQTLSLRSVVILSERGPYAVGVAQIFGSEFQRQGGQVLETIEFPPGTGDFAGLVDRVMTLTPDAVYIAAFAPEIERLIAALRGRNFGGSLLTTSAYASGDTIAKAGANANGVLFTQSVFDPDTGDATQKAFAAAFAKRFGGEVPDLFAAHGYDATRVLLEALRKSGPTADQLWKALRAIRDYPGVTGAFQFDEKGDVQKFPRVYAILEGQPENYEARLEEKREELKRRLEELRQKREQLRNEAISGGT